MGESGSQLPMLVRQCQQCFFDMRAHGQTQKCSRHSWRGYLRRAGDVVHDGNAINLTATAINQVS